MILSVLTFWKESFHDKTSEKIKSHMLNAKNLDGKSGSYWYIQ